MMDFIEFIVYLFFLMPTFFAFFLMFKCMFEDNSDWSK